ncbi:uncharacterized protein METZ01_LOCUS141831, partial [marine metagenome]
NPISPPNPLLLNGYSASALPSGYRSASGDKIEGGNGELFRRYD